MKIETKRKIGELLFSTKLRRTKPRLAVLDVLVGASKPITQEQIAAKLGPTGPNKVTIYRTLESFIKAGLAHKAYLRERTWHFELAHNCTESQCHPHFTCTNCGDTHCFTGMTLPMVKSPPHKGFVIRYQRTQFEGLCPRCSLNQ